MWKRTTAFLSNEDGAETMEYIAVLAAGVALIIIATRISGNMNGRATTAEAQIDAELGDMGAP